MHVATVRCIVVQRSNVHGFLLFIVIVYFDCYVVCGCVYCFKNKQIQLIASVYFCLITPELVMLQYISTCRILTMWLIIIDIPHYLILKGSFLSHSRNLSERLTAFQRLCFWSVISFQPNVGCVVCVHVI